MSLNDFQVIPGILEENFAEIEKKLNLIKSFTKKVHIDFIDGKFINNKTFLDPTPFKNFSNELELEAHLMVEEPIDFLEPLARAGFKRIIGQIEKMADQTEFIAKGEGLCDVGLALDGPTPISALNVSLEDLDVLLIMTIRAGFSGEEFNLKFLEKIKEIKEGIVEIEVDGGINDKTINQAKNIGANCFVSTTYIFNSQNPSEGYSDLVSLVTS